MFLSSQLLAEYTADAPAEMIPILDEITFKEVRAAN